MVISNMGSITVSLDKTYTRKVDILRGKAYPDLSFDDAVKQIIKDTLDRKVPDSELGFV